MLYIYIFIIALHSFSLCLCLFGAGLKVSIFFKVCHEITYPLSMHTYTPHTSELRLMLDKQPERIHSNKHTQQCADPLGPSRPDPLGKR